MRYARVTSPFTGCAAFARIDSVGLARRFGGTSSKITRAGIPSSRKTSMRSPMLQHDAADRRQNLGGLLGLLARAGIRAHDAHALPDGLLHQLFRRQQVVVEVLLDDREPRAREADGLRHDLRRHALELEAVPAGRNVQRPDVLDEREIRVVNRERQALVGAARLTQRRAHGRDRGQTYDNQGVTPHAALLGTIVGSHYAIAHRTACDGVPVKKP